MEPRTPPRGLLEAKSRVSLAAVDRPHATAEDVAPTVTGSAPRAFDLAVAGNQHRSPAKNPTRR